MKKWNTISSRTAARLFLMVVWFLGLLLVNNGVFAQTYTPVFSDEFDREWPAVGNDWEQPEGEDWQITTSGTVSSKNSGWWNEVLVRPSAEKYRDGKASTTFIPTLNRAYSVVARYHEGAYYNVRLFNTETNKTMNFSKVLNTSQSPNDNIIRVPVPDASLPTTSEYVLEIVTESLSPTETKLTANMYDTNGLLTFTHSINDTEPSLQTAGQRGINAYQVDKFDNFISAKSAARISLGSSSKNIWFGEEVTISVSLINSSANQTILLSDDKGGSFGSTTLTLDDNNGYTATTTYTPAQAGEITITAISSNDMMWTIQLFVSPYTTTIGFIGDSITRGQGASSPIESNNAVVNEFATLGGGFSAVNRGVPSSTVQSWLDTLLTWAIEDFNASGVEVVQIMLGTNDAGAHHIPTEIYRSNMIQLTTRLKEAGIKKIILNEPIYTHHTLETATLLQEYSVALSEIADGETVFVGDTQAYESFEANFGAWFVDITHPNNTGHAELGKLRAAAFNRIMDSQVNPNHSFTGINESNHMLWTSGELTLWIDKYFEEFNGVVKVDNIQLATSEYVATSGSTNIELNADYLNTLTAGDHTLTVGFEGGVEVVGNFSILSEPMFPPVTPPTVPTTPTYAWGGGGGISLVKDSCPNGDFSPSYYDKTCWTTADLTEEVAKKVNVLRPVIKLIYLTATEEQKTFVHNLITSCSETNKNEVIKLACADLVKNRDF